MVKVKTVTLGLLIVILGAGAASYLFPTEEKKVRKQFHLLSEQVSKKGGESPLALARKTRNLGTLFAEKCKVKTYLESFSGIYTPEEISGYAARGRLQFTELNLKFYDITIIFPEKEVAKVDLTARVKGRLTSGEDLDETHELACVLKKIENRWRFTDIEMVEVLKK